MKTRIITTTRFVASTKEEEKEFVFCMKPCHLSADLPLAQLGVKEYRVFEDNNVKIYAVTPNQTPDEKSYASSSKEWVEALIKTFCADCDSSDEIYLLLHARTDLPPTDYGPYDASNWIDNKELNIHIWAFAHEKDSNLGVQPLLTVAYSGKPTPKSFADKVRALFKLNRLVPQLKKVWTEYIKAGDQTLLCQKIIPLLKEISGIEGIYKIDVDSFISSKNLYKNSIINSLSRINILRA